MKRMISSLAVMGLIATLLSGCGYTGSAAKENNEETTKIAIAYQYGLAYAPALIVQEKQLIEEKYKESTGKEIEVTWTQMSSGADINTGIASGNIDIGFMGIAPAITGCMNEVGYKIFTNVSGQEHGIMTNKEEIQNLGDLVGSQEQIALVNIGSIQHIILAYALQNAGYDPHALDTNIVAMKHPDGMNALQTGNVVCHLTTNPYLMIERQDSSLHEVSGISEVWTKDDSFIVGVASETLHEENQELYQVVCEAISEAIDLINTDKEEAAKFTYELDGNSLDEEIAYMKDGTYSVETTGIFELAKFMSDAGFIDKAPEAYTDLVFDNVLGN